MSQSFDIKSVGTGNPIAPIIPQAGVDESNAQGTVQQQRQPQPPAQPPVASARSVSQKLDTMLFKVAQMATRSVHAVKLTKTVSETTLSKQTRTELSDVAERAAKSYYALAKYTGREIAAALVTDINGKFDWGSTAAAKALKEALDAQAELSEKLHDAVNSPEVTGEAFETLSEMALQADRRQTEIMSLALQLADAAEQNGNDPDVVARLNAKVETLLPRQSLQMHGTDDAIKRIKTELQPLADRLDTFASRPNSSITSEEFATLQRDVTLARNALARVEKEGFETPDGGRWMPDKTFFSIARQFVAFAEQKLADTRKEIGLVSVKAFVKNTFELSEDLPVVYKENLDTLSSMAPTLATAAEYRHEIADLAKSYLKNPNEATAKKLLDLSAKYATLSSTKIKNEINGLKQVGGGYMDEDDWALLQQTFKEPRGMVSQVMHLIYCIDHVNEDMTPEKFLSTDSARALFEGRLDFSTIVEARIHGMTDADVNPKLDDSNMVSMDKLGSGAANTVYLVKYKDGSEYVFKPEAAGRQGIESLTLSKDYKPDEQVAQLNLATQKTAEVLGVEDVMPKSTVGCHNGQYGLFMEKAPGCTVSSFSKNDIGKSGGLTPEQIKNLSDEQYSAVLGEIIRQTNRLEWLDLITGQGDRHNKNYMIEVRPNGKVTVKGIDNDQCFPGYRTGLRRFHLSGEHVTKFLLARRDIIASYPKIYQNEIRERLRSDPGVVWNEDDSIDIDATKFQANELHYALRKAVGLHNAVLPDFIEEDVYEHLQALKDGQARETYLADLRSRLPEDAVASAMTRLDEAIAHAELLKEKGMVIKKGDFAKHDVQKRILHRELYEGTPIKPTDDGKFCLKKGDVVTKVKYQTRSLFCRDIFRSIYRNGWYE